MADTRRESPTPPRSAFPLTACKGTDYECDCNCKCQRGLDANTGCEWPDCECQCDAACTGCRLANEATG